MTGRRLLLASLLALSPLLLAGLLWLLLILGAGNVVVNDPAYADPRIRLTLGTALSNWLLLLGAVATLCTTGGVWLWYWRGKQMQRQTVEQHQARLSQERRDFVQRLDHELKNPLTAMRAGIANLRSLKVEDSALEDGAKETLDSLEGQALRLSRLTADLRKLSELESRPLDFIEVDLSQLLQEAIELMEENPERKTRRFTANIPQAPWPLPTISGDWDLLYLAIYNLLDNAVKFTEPDDAIEIRAREEGESILIEVADTGPGIDPAEQPHIWEELYRGQTTRHIRGSGLGLALVQTIVDRHHGTIALNSRFRQGTVVTLRLPIGHVTNP